MAAFGLERVVTAKLQQTRALEHNDEISHANRREAMGHEDGHEAGVAVGPGCGSVTLEQRMFGLGIEGSHRLIEHEEQGAVPHESARQSEFLPLAERDLDTAGPGRA